MPTLNRSSQNARVERLEARVSRETKSLFERAAKIQGRSLTDFLVSSAVEAANRIVRDSEYIELSKQDRILFVEGLLNPPVPNERLKNAARRRENLVRSN